MSNPRRMITLASAALLVMLAGQQPSRADDTEIFFAVPPNSGEARANILFIMDTSGSMATEIIDNVPFDPATTYTGECSANRVYWKGSGDTDTPSCDTDRWVSTSKFVCKTAADRLAELGTWPIGPAAQWRAASQRKNSRWRDLRSDLDDWVECQADAALRHGQAANDNKYPADGNNGAFSTNVAQSITWNGETNRSYIFYSGNYLNWLYNAATTVVGTRLQIVQKAAKDTVDRLSNVNIGLMRFSSDSDGGMVRFPMTSVETGRTNFKAAIDALEHEGGTPLSETLMEAYRYWTGDTVVYGLDSTTGPALDRFGTRVLLRSIGSSRSGTPSKYISPISGACQKNFIVYLTDGDPTVDQNAEAAIEGLPAFSTLGNVTTAPNNGGQCSENGALGTEGGGAEAGDGKCLDDLARYMFNKDFFNDPAVPNDKEPKENITTFTIGFGNGVSARGLALLKATAEVAGGEFFEANNSASLTEAFNNIIRTVIEDNISFSAPAVSVNAFNRTRNLNDLFVTVFKPSDTYGWPGNLKKYRLDPNDGLIRDADNDPAVDESDGFFRDDARSFWSTEVDGADVEEGGAAHRLTIPPTRKVFTDLAALAGTQKSLSHADNALVNGNMAIEETTLGLVEGASAAERTALIEWVQGVEEKEETGDPSVPRLRMGDPLHARPVSVIYGGTASSPEAVIYVATNDGYLHAVDPSDGTELWAYVPSELLPRMANLRDNKASAVKRYALDGNLTVHRIDKDVDGKIESSEGDKVYLFFGMGRGGNNYYALDVTNKSAPQFLWRGGRDLDPVKGADFTLTGLGQSWSTPVVTRVDVKSETQNADKLVLIVGGGYDPTQDAVPYNTDNTGNGLFILDALSGRVLWRASDTGANFTHAQMNNSIPADVRVLDVTNDGFADRMYAADTGGRIWRFDIFNGKTKSDLVEGGVFASLGAAADSGGGTSPAEARRFYIAPDVSLLRANDRFYMNLAIGSGYRGHPLNTEIHDVFYSLRDPRPFLPMSKAEYQDLEPITHDDPGLVDVTTNITPTIPSDAKGWKLEFSQPSWDGEKVLSEARTFGGAILFPTFTPAGNDVVRTCTAQAGSNALYIVSASDGSPVADRDGDATLEASDRSSRLDQHGIAPAVAIIFPTPEEPCVGEKCKPKPVCLTGVEKCDYSPPDNPVRTFWNNQDADAIK